MQAKPIALLIHVAAAALLTAGCAGSGQPDAGAAVTGTAVVNASGSPGTPNDLYVDEFNQGFGYHTRASGLFNNATLLWNEDDYPAAAEKMKDARAEYALAEGHYNNMALNAGDDAERAFAGALEESAIDMDEATSRYLMSIDAAMAGNDTASLEYFREGQGLVDRSMLALNQSYDLMPSCLD